MDKAGVCVITTVIATINQSINESIKSKEVWWSVVCETLFSSALQYIIYFGDVVSASFVIPVQAITVLAGKAPHSTVLYKKQKT